MKICFLIRSLDQAGTQRQLVNAAIGFMQRGHEVVVCTLYRGKMLETELLQAGVPIFSIAKRQRWDLVSIITLIRFIRKKRPDVIQAFLEVSNIISILLKVFCTKSLVVWGIRASDIDFTNYDRFRRVMSYIEKKLSIFADLIISNSVAGAKTSIENGFPADKIVVIPNGIDTEKYRLDPEARKKIRTEWEVGDDEADRACCSI